MLSDYRKYYPLLQRYLYFDSAATALKPLPVIENLIRFYKYYDSNVYRGFHIPGAQATSLYDEARKKVADLLHTSPRNIIFTTNTTDGLHKLSHANLGKVLLSLGMHHSSLLPFLKFPHYFVKVKENGIIDLADLMAKLDMVDTIVIDHVSNVTGAIQPVEEIAEMAKRKGKTVIVDGAQSVPHMEIDVEKMGIDALAFSGHKMGAPYGSGALYVSNNMIQLMEPIPGGESIEDVSWDGKDIVIKYAEPPHCFEPGTPSIANQIGLGFAIDFIKPALPYIKSHEHDLLQIFLDHFKEKRIRYLGPELDERSSLVAIAINDGERVAYKLAQYDVCIRYGYHCAEPLHQILNSPPSLRFSLYLYNTEDEVREVLYILDRIIDGKISKKEAVIYPEPFFSSVHSSRIFDPCERCFLSGACKTPYDALRMCPYIPNFVRMRWDHED